MQKFPLNFDEETIVKIFGTEAAEDDDFDRLRSYYVKNRTHEKLTADVPIRIPNSAAKVNGRTYLPTRF